MRILMLEDNRLDAEMVCRLLRKSGVEFSHLLVSNRTDFLNALQEFKPDLVLADNQLPRYSAPEALEDLKSQSLHIPFILVTGTVLEDFAVSMIKLGADDFVLKDRLERLPNAITSALKQRQAENERREVAAKLQKSEEKYRTLVEQAFDGVLIVTESGEILDANTSASDNTGYTLEELTNMKIFDLLFPDDLKTNPPRFDKVNERGALFQQRRLKRKDGSDCEMELVIKKLPNDNYMVVGRDITDRILAHRQIEFDHNNLQSLINNTEDLIWSMDRDLKLITSNHSFNKWVERLTGVQPFKGLSLFDPRIKNINVSAFKAKLDRALQGETFSVVEYFEQPSGSWVEISFYPIIEKEAVIGTACFSRDISEQLKSAQEIRLQNERFEMVTLATNDVIWDWDLLTDKFWWSNNYYTHYGYDKETTPDNIRSWNELVHPDDKERVVSQMFSTIRKRKSFWTDEYRFRKADGTYAYVLDSGYTLFTEDGKPYRMVGAMMDQTDRIKAREELEQSYAEKEILAKRLSTILNTLPAKVALLDQDGVILEVNQVWQECQIEKGFTGRHFKPGTNYIEQCNQSLDAEDNDGQKLTNGILEVKEGRLPQYEFEYPYQGNGDSGWFRMVVSPLHYQGYSGVVVMHVDISQVKKLEQERLQSRLQEQKRITRAMLRGQEKERNQIGRELHDNISQLMAAIKMKLGFSISHPEKAELFIQQSFEIIQEAINETRNLSHRMVMPRFAESSLEDEMTNLLHQYQNQERKTNLRIVGVEEMNIPSSIKETLYRIAQEQLHNVEKYAQATRVELEIMGNASHLSMRIEDNGVGFDTSRKRNGIGLTNIHNRAESYNGSAMVISSPGKGCRLYVEIPINNQVSEESDLVSVSV